MAFLLWLVSFFFCFIFFSFFNLEKNEGSALWDDISLYKFESLSWNLIVETLLFFTVWLFLFFYFFNSGIWKSDFQKDWFWFNKDIFKKWLSLFFKKYLYYIGFIFFYFWVYFIFESMEIGDFWHFIFFVNLLIGVLFFIIKKLFIFRDFIKINTILFSFYYIFSYIYFFFTGDEVFSWIDFLNSFLVLLFFIISIYFDKKILGKQFGDTALVSYFFVYSFLVF